MGASMTGRWVNGRRLVEGREGRWDRWMGASVALAKAKIRGKVGRGGAGDE